MYLDSEAKHSLAEHLHKRALISDLFTYLYYTNIYVYIPLTIPVDNYYFSDGFKYFKDSLSVKSFVENSLLLFLTSKSPLSGRGAF